MLRKFAGLLALGLIALVGASTGSAAVLYTQPFDLTGNAYSSQNDTTGGNGHYATVYDNFKWSSSSAGITEVQWTGEYFNPPSQAPITGWTVTFYADNAGQPGAVFQSTFIAGTGGEGLIGTFGGFPTYLYDISLSTPFGAAANTEYWMSVVPDLGFPPQWGWSSSATGDGVGYQDFFGTRSNLGKDMAFTLLGTPTPEPLSLGLVGAGLVLIGLRARRRG